MVRTDEFLLRARLEIHELEAWIEAGWLAPRDDAERPFSEIDLARVELVRDLREDLGVNDEGVEVILSLLDQVHGLRRTLRLLLAAIREEPEDMRRRIAATIAERAADLRKT